MAAATSTSRARRLVTAVVCGVAALAGLVSGYDFGLQLGGALVGVVMAVNGAVFCAILAGAAIDRLARWRRASGHSAE